MKKVVKRKKVVKKRKAKPGKDEFLALKRSILSLKEELHTLKEGMKEPKPTFPANHGARWEEDDDARLLDLYSELGYKNLKILGSELGRTPFSIFMRLLKLGKVGEGNVYKLWATAL